MKDIEELKKIAGEIRRDVIEISHSAKVGHIGPALSIADILTVLYFKIMRVNPKKPKLKDRDRFILSKGHASSVLYAVLHKKGFFGEKTLKSYCQNGAFLAEHPESHIPGVEATTGSLGHGLSLGVGMALAGKSDGLKYRVFVQLSDGECDEGSTWEAALSAGHFRLDNLVAIVDYNKLQAFGRTYDVMNLEPFSQKWEAFGWRTKEIDGHNLKQIVKTFEDLPIKKGRPNLIISHSLMGKGVSFMEDKLAWHYNTMKPEEYEQAVKELEGKG